MSLPMTGTDAKKLPIAVDAMGGDKGPREVVDGAIQAARTLGIHSILVGDEPTISAALAGLGASNEAALTIRHASQVITMEDTPSLAIRGKADASMRVACELVSSGCAGAVVSCGNTGALMASGLFVFGTLVGVARPAIASLIPTGGGGPPTVLLDSGANSGCQAFQLVQFALMGRHYATIALGTEKPRVALLSNGTELSKGNDIIRSAAMMLADMPGIEFVGFVEGRDIARGSVDVVVCDGFVGNIVLKAMEGTVELVLDSMKLCAEKSLRAKIGLGLARPALRAIFKERLDPSAYGGAPLLGLAKITIKCHGSSSSRAILNGIKFAHKFASEDLLGRMSSALSEMDIKVEGVDGDGVWGRMGQRLEKGRRGGGRRESPSSEGPPLAREGEKNE